METQATYQKSTQADSSNCRLEWLVLSQRPLLKAYLGDCMILMASTADNYYDLAITDPPYGIGKDWEKRNNGREKYPNTTYENIPVNEKYFQELRRVSKNVIIWGYNYYTEYLGSTNYLIIWDKQSSDNDVFKYSKCEIAYTNLKIPCNIFSYPWDGYRMGSETGKSKIHPHQKPVALYRWLLKNYAKAGQRILDTHGGSFSSAVACHTEGYEIDICEIDKEYFDAGVKRFKEATCQLKMF